MTREFIIMPEFDRQWKSMGLNDCDLKELQETPEGRAYLEYNERVGGGVLGLMVPFGYPPGVDDYGGVIGVYRECVKRGVTWETLLDYHPDPDADI